jgi:hypothetical protein
VKSLGELGITLGVNLNEKRMSKELKALQETPIKKSKHPIKNQEVAKTFYTAQHLFLIGYEVAFRQNVRLGFRT